MSLTQTNVKVILPGPYAELSEEEFEIFIKRASISKCFRDKNSELPCVFPNTTLAPTYMARNGVH